MASIMWRALRDAEWLDRNRVRGYPAAIALTLAVVLIGLVSLSDHSIGPRNTPIGTDFTSFRAAASLAAQGHAEDVYNRAIHHAAERALFGGKEIGYYAFFYPPTFLLICLPLALLPYPWALAVWLAATGYGFWRAIRKLLPGRDAIFPILGFPAFFVNAGYGQNGLLSGALLGFGALLLPGRPVLAGFCWGGLIIKPHLGILIPAVLIAARAWRAVAGAAFAAVMLAGASWAVLGTQAWAAFFASSETARMAMERGEMGYEKLQSVFAAARIAGFGVTAAYAVQAASAVLAIYALTSVARRHPSTAAPGIALLAATPLASPFLLTYDLAMLGFPIAWLAAEGLASGFRPWEKVTLLMAYLLPLLAALNGNGSIFLPWTPFVTAILLIFVMRRARP